MERDIALMFNGIFCYVTFVYNLKNDLFKSLQRTMIVVAGSNAV